MDNIEQQPTDEDVIAYLKEEGYSEEDIKAVLDEASRELTTKAYKPIPEGKTEADIIKYIKDEISKQALMPDASAAIAIESINHKVVIADGEYGIEGIAGLDLDTLGNEIKKQNEALASGDISRIESMLLDQSHILQAMFVNYLQRSAVSNDVHHFEVYSRLALKAQNQTRQTIATLGDLKNPKRTTFVKQQNNAVNQQINNGQVEAKNSEKTVIESNELSESGHERTLDSRTTQAASRKNPLLEAVGEIHRGKNSRRKKAI